MFNSFQRPYREADIVRFNLRYQRVYLRLGRAEKRLAQEYIDALMAGIDREELMSEMVVAVGPSIRKN